MLSYSRLTLSLFFALLQTYSANAKPSVAGLGRLSLNANQQVQFNLDTFASSVGSIVSSVNSGPNRTVEASLPVENVYGVNYGNWLLFEPWMSPTGWTNMGGEFCAGGDCSICRNSEWSLASYLGQEKTNEAFQQHWQSWLTQDDVDEIVAAGLNTVRLPLGFWIVEDIVDRTDEPYAQGGLDELIRGLTMFKAAGLNVLLDHHALPGVSSSKQMFAGNCTDQVHFYDSPDDYNYKRAVTWSIVITYLSHVHPAFSTVFGIEAINEPLQDASKTPGLGRFEISFVLGVRAMEFLLGITCDATYTPSDLSDPIARSALSSAIPIIARLSLKYNLTHSSPLSSSSNISAVIDFKGKLVHAKLAADINTSAGRKGKCLSTTFMNRDWQWNNPANPTDAARGPQVYDNHLYFNFGGVAPNATAESYMQTLCNTTRISQAIDIGNAPLVTGEWSLATAFQANNTFLQMWSDAQKLTYTQGSGWIFWNWKIDSDGQTYPLDGAYRQWSYRDALKAGIMTAKPDQYFNKDICSAFL